MLKKHPGITFENSHRNCDILLETNGLALYSSRGTRKNVRNREKCDLSDCPRFQRISNKPHNLHTILRFCENRPVPQLGKKHSGPEYRFLCPLWGTTVTTEITPLFDAPINKTGIPPLGMPVLPCFNLVLSASSSSRPPCNRGDSTPADTHNTPVRRAARTPAACRDWDHPDRVPPPDEILPAG